MLKHFDHVTVVVNDVAAAKQFFSLLGFTEVTSVVIKGQQFSDYMGVDGIEAEHITLVLANVLPRTEVQLLKYHHPNARLDPAITDLTKLGFNHVCRRSDWGLEIYDKTGKVMGRYPDFPLALRTHLKRMGYIK